MKSKKQTVKSLYKKLLCFAAAFAMMAVILLPSVTVKAANGLLILYGQGYRSGYSSFENALFKYDANAKKLTLKRASIACQGRPYVISSVQGLTICVEKDVAVYGGDFTLRADTTITGPGKLTIAQDSKGARLTVGIYVTDGGKLTIDNANIDVNMEDTRFPSSKSWAICGDETGERLIVKNSVIHAKANYAAISDFDGFMDLTGCNVVSPRYAVTKHGNVYQSDGATFAKEAKISNLYIVNQPESRVTGAVGDYVTLKVTANRAGAKYQWQRYNRERSRWENVNFSGAQSSTMRFQVDESMYSWRFRCVITSGSETINTDDVNLWVVAKITSQPDSTVYVNSGATVLLKVTAEGTISRYTWQYYNNSTGKWVNLTSGTNFYNVGTKSMTVKGNSTTNNMKFRCAVMNTFGYTTYTDETTLKVR